MKKSKKIPVLFTTLIFVALMLLSFATLSFAASDSTFEKQLAEFPESYHPYLRQLHEKYPKWNFIAFDTGLDWETVIDNEHNDYALVYNPDAARIFKSLDEDDYDAENDRFYYKDGSFVAASRIAVEYFMDPRNFLDIGGIFQFELLSFSSLYTVDMVEAVLENSFMANKKMTWLDTKGKKQSSSDTYAETIYKAGKTYNINPCFLASKILNEVGSNGSTSVSGDNKKYPGIYNFYNIGATDGAGAVERGLLWAKGGSSSKKTYGRPWTSPYKSIMGGAAFLAEDYIAAGQFTGYLQRFNVNADSDYELYTHQYMSNLTGALSQGYSTYKSYLDTDMLDKSLTFSIPVYKNMSNADGSGKLCGAESTLQYGTVNRDYLNVRSGPSVDHEIVKTSSGKKLNATKGTEVRILEKVDTDAYYFEEILTYPYWYKISFTLSGKTYQGYIPASRIDLKTAVYVAKGQTDIAFAKDESIRNKLFASDPSMVKIIDSNTVNFLKSGYVTLYIYDSWGHIEEIRFRVGSYSSYYVSDLEVKVSDKSAIASSDIHSKADSIGYSLCDMSGNIIKADFDTKTSRSFSGLKYGAAYDVFAQNRFSKYIFSKAVQAPVVIKPETVQNLDFTKDSSGICRLYWDRVSDATGYQIVSYNEETDKYTKVYTVSEGTTSYTLSQKQSAAADKYVVRAYTKYDGELVYGSYSNQISLASKAPEPSKLTVTNKTTSSFTVSWTGNEACDGYELYIVTPGATQAKYYKTLTSTSLKISGFKSLSYRKYQVRSFIKASDKKIYSDFTGFVEALTLPQTPKGLKATTTSETAKLEWSAVSGADYYNLFYKEGDGRYKSVKVTDNSYTFKSLAAYTDYSFYVTAVAKEGSVSSEGAACTAITARTKPPVPTGLKVSYQGYNHIDFSWNENSILDSYAICYMDSSGKVLGNLSTTDNKVRVKGLGSLETYKFKIIGYKNVGKEKLASDYSSVVTSKTVIPVVENFKATAVESGYFKLAWTKLEGATKYNLYYKQGDSYKKILSPTENSCTVKVLPESSKGYFYLTAVFGKGDGAVESEKTRTFTASVKPAKVTGITVTPTQSSVNIKWNKVKNATGYRVYVLKDGKYVLKKKLNGTSYTLKGLDSCKSVTISVRAYISSTLGTAYSDHATKSFYTLPLNITKITQSKKTDTSYTLSWNKSSDTVNRYYVYRYDSKKKTYKRIGVTQKTSMKITGITPGTTQRYTVVAAYVKNKKVVSKSERICELECSTYLSKTNDFKVAKRSSSALQLTWDKVPGATSYRIYLYNTKAKEFKLFKKTTKTSIIIRELKPSTKYVFRINAIKSSGGKVYKGYYSDNLSARTK